MTFPTVPTTGASTLLTSNQSTATTTHTFPNLSNLPNTPGALLLAVIVTYQGGSANAEFSSWGGGFTEFVDQSANSTTVQSIGAAYKLNATGSESGTFTVTTVASTRSVMFLMEIVGAHASEVPVATAKANGTGAAADPAALNPAGWDVEDTLWVAVAVNGETSLTGSFTGITAAPTNYTSYADSGIIGGDVIGALEGAVAFRQNATASEDVGTFTLDVGAAGNSALLIAVRPVPAPPPVLPFADDFTGTNGAAWDAAKWANDALGGGTVDIQSNEGRELSGTGAFNSTIQRALTGTLTDCELLTRFKYNAIPADGAWFGLRSDTSAGFDLGYIVVVSSTFTHMYRRQAGSNSLGTVSTATLSAGTYYWLRFQCVGTTIRARLWADGTAEPSAWGFSTTDANLASGVPRLRVETDGTPSQCDLRVDHVLVSDPNAGLPPPPLVAPGAAVTRAYTY